MCRAVTCKKCGKTTWAGCGQHVNQVLAGVPASRRCTGHASDPAASGGWLGKLIGRRLTPTTSHTPSRLARRRLRNRCAAGGRYRRRVRASGRHLYGRRAHRGIWSRRGDPHVRNAARHSDRSDLTTVRSS